MTDSNTTYKRGDIIEVTRLLAHDCLNGVKIGDRFAVDHVDYEEWPYVILQNGTKFPLAPSQVRKVDPKVGDLVVGSGTHHGRSIEARPGVIVDFHLFNDLVPLVDFGFGFTGHAGNYANRSGKNMSTRTHWYVPVEKLRLRVAAPEPAREEPKTG
eukprot:gene22145-23204_t